MPSVLKYILLLGFLFQISCKSSFPVRPSEHYNDVNFEVNPSILNIPIRIHKAQLQAALNEEFGDILYEDDDLENGLSVKAKKEDNIEIDIDNEFIQYKIPLHLWIKKSLFLGNAEAEGNLTLAFKTRYQILPDWSLITETEVEGYEWQKKPVLKLGFADLPIKFIANLVLNNLKENLATTIDESIRESFSLREQMNAAWTEFQEPILASEEYKTWFVFNPQKIEMSPFRESLNIFSRNITITAFPKIVIGEKPNVLLKTQLPDFVEVEQGTDAFFFEMETSVSFAEAERISKENMIGEEYEVGRKKVVIKDIELYGKGNQLVVNTLLDGNYKGNLYFLGEPKYNARKNRIELENVEFDFTSQRFLLKSASWLFKGSLKRAVQDNLDFYLDENVEEIKKMLKEELEHYEIAKGIILTGNLDELAVSHVYVAPDGIHVRVGMMGKLNVDVKGF